MDALCHIGFGGVPEGIMKRICKSELALECDEIKDSAIDVKARPRCVLHCVTAAVAVRGLHVVVAACGSQGQTQPN